MAKSKESFDRRQRERAKKAKAELKRQERFNKEADPDGEDVVAEEGPKVDQDVVLDQLAKLHATYEDERISFEDFETRRAELLAQLQV
jgi:hypothetical protein